MLLIATKTAGIEHENQPDLQFYRILQAEHREMPQYQLNTLGAPQLQKSRKYIKLSEVGDISQKTLSSRIQKDSKELLSDGIKREYTQKLAERPNTVINKIGVFIGSIAVNVNKKTRELRRRPRYRNMVLT